MNLQQIIDPLGKFIDNTFRNVLVPISELFNWATIAVGIIGLLIWLKLQKDFNRKASEDNTLA